MTKAKSMTFYRTIFLVLFLVFEVSLETAAKHVNSVASGKTTKGTNSAEWLKLDKDKASKKMMQRDPGYVYIMKEFARQFPEEGYIKIGKTVDPVTRRVNLQTGNARPIQLFCVWGVNDMKSAEDDFHQAMQKYKLTNLRQNTEWFKPPRRMNLEDEGDRAMRNYIRRKICF